MFSNVVLEGTKIGGVTDANGFFNLSKVPAGQYKLVDILVLKVMRKL